MSTGDEILSIIPAAQPFEYTPLVASNQIRLLEVEPADNLDAPLHGTLHHIDLQDDNRLTYVALSYAWGQSSTRETILINGHPIHIQKNLFRALQYFRASSADRYIWADALCINQMDTVEKSWQVPLMGQIFREALRVRVWLGDDVEEVELIRRVRALTRKMVALSPHVAGNMALGLMTDSEVSSSWNLLHDLVQLTWFHRLWVVQEVALNPVVSLFCGFIEIPWPRLASVVKALRDHPTWSQQPREMQSLHSFIDVWESSTMKFRFRPISLLLMAFQRLKCTDDRDRIAALLALSSDIGPNPLQHDHLFQIDYTKSIEPNYITFAETFAARRQFHEIFKRAAQRRTNSDDSGLPSWVPDWRDVPGFSADQFAYMNHQCPNTVFQKSQTMMTYRIVTPVKYRTIRRHTGNLPEAGTRIRDKTRISKGALQDIDSCPDTESVADDQIFPLELRWQSSCFHSSQLVDVSTSFVTWITKVAGELFKWISGQNSLLEGGEVTWPLVLGCVLRIGTLGHYSFESRRRLPVPESLCFEEENSTLQFISEAISHMEDRQIGACLSSFHSNRIIAWGVSGFLSTKLEDHVLGVASKDIEPGDKPAILNSLKFYINEFGEFGDPESIFYQRGDFMEGFYLFRPTSIAIQQEEYTTLRLQAGVPSLQNAFDSEEETRSGRYDPKDVSASTRFAYKLVGICRMYRHGRYGGDEGRSVDFVDSLNRRLPKGEKEYDEKNGDMGLIIC